MAATAAVGAIVAGGASFAIPPHYVSSATVSITPQSDPLRNTSPQALRQRAMASAPQVQSQILSRINLSSVIQDPSLQLYSDELRTEPLEDIIERMRQDIRIDAGPATDNPVAPILLGISFAYPDREKAQAAVRALTGKAIGYTSALNRKSDAAYHTFWSEQAESEVTKALPPPPPGLIAGVMSPATMPRESSGMRHASFFAWGAGSGILLGLLVALVLRWPRRAWHLGRFALAGCVAGGAVSLLIPVRYTSSAVMQLTPAALAADPHAPLPPVTPVAVFLRKTAVKVLSVPGLSAVMQSPRLDLYPEERMNMPLEDVIKKMARNVHIEPAVPALTSNGSSSAFTVSFSYRDRFKAQLAVTELVTQIQDTNTRDKSANSENLNRIERVIQSRSAGENLEVVDTASLPNPSETPRIAIAAGGLVGLLFGAIKLYRRQSRMPILQPA